MKINKKYFHLFLYLLCFSFIFGILYVYNEDNVYIYDYIGYQLRWKELSGKLSIDFLDGIKYLFLTIKTLDYNSFPIFFLFPVYIILGYSRLYYILSMIFIYLVPFFFIVSKYFYDKVISHKNDYFLFITLIIFIFTFSSFWGPLLRGYPDIFGIIPLFILFYRLNPYDENISYKDLIINGLLIYLSFLIRRWYAYSIISSFVSLFLISFVRIIKSKNYKLFFILIKNLFVTGITSLLFVIIFQFSLMINILKTSYSNAYSAYQVDFVTHIISFVSEYSYFLLFFLLISIIVTIINKKYIFKVFYSLLNMILFVLLFTRVQGIGMQHYLGISLYFCIICCYGIIQIYELIKLKKVGYFFLISISFISMLNFSTTFIFRDKYVKFLTQDRKYYKFRYQNYDELLRFNTDLSEVLSKDYGYVSFFASNDNISDSLLETMGSDIVRSRIFYTSNIDLRDGINFNSLLYKYVVVSDVPQAGTSIDGQQVLVYPNNLIINSLGIGKNYERVLGPYTIQDNVNIYLYKKVSNFSPQDIESYLNYFYFLYPEWENDISYFDKVVLSSLVKLGDSYGDFKRLDNDTYYFHPGYDSTVVDLNFDSKINVSLDFYLDSNIPDNVVTLINIKKNGKKYKSFDLTSFNHELIDLDLDINDIISIEVNYGDDFSYDRVYMDYKI